ncbi:MAG: heterodisulfide reductase-related iron-sulfur binding cluster [Nitrososphaerales archaeon]
MVDPSLYSIAYYLIYAFALASVATIFVSVLKSLRKSGGGLPLSRVLSLAKDEADRTLKWDPVQLMHVSIVLGVGLSILMMILDPFWTFLSPLKIILLVVSFPLVFGLIAAFVWRIQRFRQSKKVETEHQTSVKFTAASSKLQIILMVTILFTTIELALGWFATLTLADIVLNIARNGLVVAYYSKPAVNLVQNFDRPLPSMRLPFKLSDVLEGKTDASQIKIGVSTISEFENYEKMSYDSCVEIGACESACPATAAGRPLSPRVLVREISVLAKANGASVNPFDSVKEDELWSCTSCGACVHSCPVAVKHLDIIYDLRRNLVGTGKLDKDKTALLQNLAQNQNPYGFNSNSRADWARDQGIDTIATNPNAEYVYWVGCVSSFDQRAQSIAKSLAKILKHSGVSFAILGNEEACNGDPARRLGEEGRYQELAYQNIAKLNSFGVKKIITSCPHCFNAIKNEYPMFGGNYKVVHHSQIISDLIEEGKVSIPESKLREISVTLHDACYAVRYNSIFEEPRKVLKAVSNDVKEMKRTKDKTFCCGAGGSNYWYKVPQQKTISGIRTKEALETGASTLATECPFCLSMFEDSTRVEGTKMDVRDIAEIVADQLPPIS